MVSVVAKGLDVSKHQKTVDWEKVKAAGVQFAIIRAGYGRNNIDPYFKRNITECARLGIPVGIFWFSYALNEAEAKKEAEYCLAAIEPYEIEYPVFFDLEYDTDKYMKKNGVTLTKSIATRHAEVFLAAIEKAGYYAGLYANPDYLGRFFDASLLQKYDLWLAHYMDNPDLSSPSRSCGVWQHSSTGSVSGISGHVDLDVAYKDYPAIIRAAGMNRLTPLDGWVETEKGWYWYEKGQPVKAAWRKITGASGVAYWYYLGKDGVMLTGMQRIDGKVYYLNPEAALGVPEGACIMTDEDGVVYRG